MLDESIKHQQATAAVKFAVRNVLRMGVIELKIGPSKVSLAALFGLFGTSFARVWAASPQTELAVFAFSSARLQA